VNDNRVIPHLPVYSPGRPCEWPFGELCTRRVTHDNMTAIIIYIHRVRLILVDRVVTVTEDCYHRHLVKCGPAGVVTAKMRGKSAGATPRGGGGGNMRAEKDDVIFRPYCGCEQCAQNIRV